MFVSAESAKQKTTSDVVLSDVNAQDGSLWRIPDGDLTAVSKINSSSTQLRGNDGTSNDATHVRGMLKQWILEIWHVVVAALALLVGTILAPLGGDMLVPVAVDTSVLHFADVSELLVVAMLVLFVVTMIAQNAVDMLVPIAVNMSVLHLADATELLVVAILVLLVGTIPAPLGGDMLVPVAVNKSVLHLADASELLVVAILVLLVVYAFVLLGAAVLVLLVQAIMVNYRGDQRIKPGSVSDRTQQLLRAMFLAVGVCMIITTTIIVAILHTKSLYTSSRLQTVSPIKLLEYTDSESFLTYVKPLNKGRNSGKIKKMDTKTTIHASDSLRLATSAPSACGTYSVGHILWALTLNDGGIRHHLHLLSAEQKVAVQRLRKCFEHVPKAMKSDWHVMRRVTRIRRSRIRQTSSSRASHRVKILSSCVFIANNAGLKRDRCSSIHNDPTDPDGALSKSPTQKIGRPRDRHGNATRLVVSGDGVSSILQWYKKAARIISDWNRCLELWEYETGYPLPRTWGSSEDFWSVEGLERNLVATAQLWLENFSGEAWSWYPFPEPDRGLELGRTRLEWNCECGERTAETTTDKLAEALVQLFSSNDTATIAILQAARVQAASTVSPTNAIGASLPSLTSSSGSSSIVNSQIVPLAPNSTQGLLTLGAANSLFQASPDSTAAKKHYILLCVRNGDHAKADIIELDPSHNDDQFFNEFKTKYLALRGWWRRWFSPRKFSFCHVSKFDKWHVDKLGWVCNELPILNEYVYAPRPRGSDEPYRPPLSEHEWRHRFYRSHQTPGASDALLRLPKRDRRFELGLCVSREYFWGLDVQYRISALAVILWMMAIMAPGIFALGWLLRPSANVSGGGDGLQTAAVPVTLISGAMMLLWLPLNEKFKDR